LEVNDPHEKRIAIQTYRTIQHDNSLTSL